MTLLYFGSFSPIHLGHIALVRYFIENIIVDEVILIPSPQNPLKDSKNLWNADLRKCICEVVCEELSHVTVSDVEFNLPTPNYTINTLNELKGRFPDKEFAILIGEDNYQIFDKWKDYDKILEQFTIFVYPRGESKSDRTRFPQMKWIDAPLLDISSTQIRKALSEGKEIGEWVTPKEREMIYSLIEKGKIEV